MPTNNEIKLINGLKDKKRRDEAGLFVAEGIKVVQELLRSKMYLPTSLYALPAYMDRISEDTRSRFQWNVVSDLEMKRMSLLQTPSEVLALVHFKPFSFEPFLSAKWSLLLDGIQDPGNLGTIIRIADWFGISNIYATPDTADCYNPKVVQASMGSIFRVKLMYGPCNEWLQNPGVPVYGTAMQGQSIWEAGKLPCGVLVIGNEGKGMRAEIATQVRHALTIPKLGHAESLNAGVAAGIILSHLLQPSTES